MCTDTSTINIYLVSIPFSCMCFFTASMRTSSLWKIPAARAASTSVFSKTSEKCSTFPAPEDAYDRDGNVFADVFHQFNIKAATICLILFYRKKL